MARCCGRLSRRWRRRDLFELLLRELALFQQQFAGFLRAGSWLLVH